MILSTWSSAAARRLGGGRSSICVQTALRLRARSPRRGPGESPTKRGQRRAHGEIARHLLRERRPTPLVARAGCPVWPRIQKNTPSDAELQRLDRHRGEGRRTRHVCDKCERVNATLPAPSRGPGPGSVWRGLAAAPGAGALASYRVAAGRGERAEGRGQRRAFCQRPRVDVDRRRLPCLTNEIGFNQISGRKTVVLAFAGKENVKSDQHEGKWA